QGFGGHHHRLPADRERRLEGRLSDRFHEQGDPVLGQRRPEPVLRCRRGAALRYRRPELRRPDVQREPLRFGRADHRALGHHLGARRLGPLLTARTTDTTTQDAYKRAAAAAALELVTSGTVIGLGTGSTVRPLLELLGARLAARELRDLVAVPTSE